MSKSEINFINSIDVSPETATPMMQQFLQIKQKQQGILLLYRMGDFYEAFFEDAVLLSRELQITLTSREAGSLGRIAMAGIPVKSLNNYIPKLLDKNLKVSICEQLEDPQAAKGLVKRDIVRTLTAGTIIEDDLLNSTKNNYLAGIYRDKRSGYYGFAYCDVSTGEFRVTEADYEQLLSELARIKPSEVLANNLQQKILPFQVVAEETIDLPEEICQQYNCTGLSASLFEEDNAKRAIQEIFNINSLDSFGFNDFKSGLCATGAVLQYIAKTQLATMPKFDVIKRYELDEYVSIDMNTRRNLELTQTSREKTKFGSLFWAIDKTSTGMGARLLQTWINQPLKNIEKIKERQNTVEEFFNLPALRVELKKLLLRVQDIERLSSKISNATANPRDFLALKSSLEILPELKTLLSPLKTDFFRALTNDNADLTEYADIIDKTVSPDAPIAVKDGNVIKQGVSTDLDYLRNLLSGGDDWLAEFEQEQKEQTGIKSLKVGFSKTFGYFIEITNSNLSLAPQDYVRKQTLTGGERFITEALKKHEAEVFTAQAKSLEIEYKIFGDFREYSKEFVVPIRKIAKALSMLDALLSLAYAACENNYVKPEMTQDNEIFIKDGRHAVLEKILPLGKYVGNDLEVAANSQDGLKTQFMILTGPNMAGKSTYMRQNALIIILAQIGSFVPCEYAKIGIVDKIFTRVGAVDDLSLGQSTFMVEMNETAYILNSATEKSLILLDEIGRGTSTYDGVAIAWSVAEYIATEIGARTIFATHYHELNVMPDKFSQIKNYRVTISEQDGHIEFLRKVVPGSASKSYGIQVAKMAGLPNSVVSKAEGLMTRMQKHYAKNLSTQNKKSSDDLTPQLSLGFD